MAPQFWNLIHMSYALVFTCMPYAMCQVPFVAYRTDATKIPKGPRTRTYQHPPNFPLRHPKYHLRETKRPFTKVQEKC